MAELFRFLDFKGLLINGEKMLRELRMTVTEGFFGYLTMLQELADHRAKYYT